VFYGATHTNLDGKGRLNMPTRFRELFKTVANDRVAVTKHPHGGLMVFPQPEWEQFRDKITVATLDDQWLRRELLGYSMEVELDKTGRLLISPELREEAHMKPGEAAVLLGVGKYLELWDKATYDDQRSRSGEQIRHGFKQLAF
jgi:MraZ protein